MNKKIKKNKGTYFEKNKNNISPNMNKFRSKNIKK